MSLMMFYDSVDPSGIPAHPGGVFAYCNGRYRWPASAIAWFRDARIPVRLIDVMAGAPEIAHVLDVERGDATPAQAHQWITARHATGKMATLYCNLATVPAVFSACAGKAYHLIVARWDGVPGIEVLNDLPPGVVIAGHQYASHPRYDVSVMDTAWVEVSGR